MKTQLCVQENDKYNKGCCVKVERIEESLSNNHCLNGDTCLPKNRVSSSSLWFVAAGSKRGIAASLAPLCYFKRRNLMRKSRRVAAVR